LRVVSTIERHPVRIVEPACRVRRVKPRPAPPALHDLPRMTSGKYKNEYRMTVTDFAGHCGVAVPTVRDWIHDRLIEVEKHGGKPQSRVTILSGERERRLQRIGAKTQRALTMRLD